MTDGDNEREDRRSEARITAGDTGVLTVTSAPKPVEAIVTIIDGSRSGLQIEMVDAMEMGSTVEIRLGDVTVLGTVEHCRPLPSRPVPGRRVDGPDDRA